jgi:hypothetical protein
MAGGANRMMCRHRELWTVAALAAGLLSLSPAGAQNPEAKPASAGKPVWQDLLRIPQRELDPATFDNNALRIPKGLKTGQFTFEYVPPQDPKHVKIYDLMREKEVLQRFQAFLTPLFLPNTVRLEIAGCDGRINAHFWRNVITVCYEYFEWIWKNTPRMAKFGLPPRDAMNGPTVDVFLHEVGHAALQLLDIPLLGSEEDAADYFATFLILQFAEEDARRLIMGASFIFGREALKEQESAPELAELAGRHSLPAQRYFNRLCMAYGKDPQLYADVVERGMLTRQRADHCAYEYAYISDAFRRLVGPYIDQDLASKVKAIRWFEFESEFSDVKPQPARERP